MMSPWPCRIIAGTTARETRNTLFRVRAQNSNPTLLHSSRVPDRKSPMPALFTSIPTGPSRFFPCQKQVFSASPARVTSAVFARKISRSAPCNSSAVARKPFGHRVRKWPLPHPARPTSSQWPRPIPRLAPGHYRPLEPASRPLDSVAVFVLLMPAITILLSSGDHFRAKTHLNIQAAGTVVAPSNGCAARSGGSTM